VRDVCHTSEARVMVEIMVMLAHKLGLTCCAEGVETPEILDFLTKSECDRAQGYLIGKPVPGDQLPGIMKSWNDSQSPAQPSSVTG